MTIEWKVVGHSTNDSLVASGGVITEEAAQVRVAPTVPPAEWFTHAPAHDKAYPVSFDADGRVHGYVSKWGITHISFLNKDVYTPRSETNYAKFRTGRVLLDDGSQIATGRLTINAVHPKKMREAHNSVNAYYDDSGCAVADVTVFEDEIGIFVAGAVRPMMTPEKIRIARGSDWSPDWRMFRGNLEMVGALAVNLSGYIVDGLVASGGLPDDMTADDVWIPSSKEQYCEVDTNGELVCFIGAPFKSDEEVSAVADLAALEKRVLALEAKFAADETSEPADEEEVSPELADETSDLQASLQGAFEAFGVSVTVEEAIEEADSEPEEFSLEEALAAIEAELTPED